MVDNANGVLIHSLLEKTRASKLNWETASPNSYFTSINKYSVLIGLEERFDESIDYILSIFDQEGNAIERFTDVDLKSESIEDAFTQMKELHNLARRNAAGTDKAVSGIIDALDNL
jgi:hypothetical protein